MLSFILVAQIVGIREQLYPLPFAFDLRRWISCVPLL
jgi:hypothetical protein